MSANRIAIVGSLIAALGFFFLPILEVRPNRLASGQPFGLLEISGDWRYLLLFLLTLVPLIISFNANQLRRGWALVATGNIIMFLSLLLPAEAGSLLLADAATFFEEGTRISNPRVLTSSAIAAGLLGGYIVLFGGLLDLRAEGVGRGQRLVWGFIGFFFIFVLLINGSLDVYSILVEFEERGDTLGQRFIEHFVFVLVTLIAGMVIGIALGLWASRDERVEDVVLYAVGIIQTVPSLALFGVLLVPLARLGDQQLENVLVTGIGLLVLGFVWVGALFFIGRFIPENLRATVTLGTVALLLVPGSVLAVIIITVASDIFLDIVSSTESAGPFIAVVSGLVASLFFVALKDRVGSKRQKRVIEGLRLVILVSALFGLIVLIGQAASNLGGDPISEMTVRDLGVSGIGTAPALIALTLYSLLPLVRNTYAGLNNIDAAIIDSGRGMGMTPRQIFFQIELPLAFPIIMAGVRNAGISLVGITAVASIIGAGALGDFILLGINSTSIDLILLGAIPAVFLAIILDALLQFFEALFTSPGIRQ